MPMFSFLLQRKATYIISIVYRKIILLSFENTFINFASYVSMPGRSLAKIANAMSYR